MRAHRTFVLAALLSAAAAASAQEGPPMPTPGPEHELLKKDVGTWDATVEMLMPPPGTPPMPGTETNTLGPGGLWLISDFRSSMMGAPFQGHGVSGWDPAKKKYVGSWVDSMTTSVALTESTYDPASKSMTGWVDGPGPDGKPTRTKAVTQYKDDDTRVFTMYMPGPDGKEAPGMRITYKRRK